MIALQWLVPNKTAAQAIVKCNDSPNMVQLNKIQKSIFLCVSMVHALFMYHVHNYVTMLCTMFCGTLYGALRDIHFPQKISILENNYFIMCWSINLILDLFFTLSKDEKEDKSCPKEGTNAKPPYSYVALISMAIKKSQERKLLVSTKNIWKKIYHIYLIHI